jgi:sugar/nucleoside kinase (ribokinase family)
MSETRVVVLGDVMLDVVTVLSDEPAHGSDTASRISLQPGGSAANVAAWLATEGTTVAYIGRVGDDETGRQAVAALREAAVDTRVTVDPTRPTGTCVVLVHPDGERSMFPEVGANAALSVQDVDEAFPDVDASWHLHVSGYALLSGAKQAALHALATARRRHVTTSVTCASAAPLHRVGVAAFLDLTRDVQLIFANAEEAKLLTGRSDPADAAMELTRSYAAVVVTCGSAGAVFAATRQAPVHSPALHVEAVDTTGAGDAFAAGFLPAWLSDAPPKAALAAGHRRAARAVTQLGGRPALD